MAGEKKQMDTQKLSGGVRRLLILLIIQFLLGMAVNLLGLPSETTGINKIASAVSLGLHTLLALGLLVGAILTVKRARAIDAKYVRVAWSGAMFIIITIAAGVLTIVLGNDWWSYIMAAGFIATFVVYGKLLLQTK